MIISFLKFSRHINIKGKNIGVLVLYKIGINEYWIIKISYKRMHKFHFSFRHKIKEIELLALSKTFNFKY